MKLQNKVAVVTGAGHGIGRAIVEELAGNGVDVAFTYRKDEEGANDLANSQLKQNHKVKGYQVSELADDTQVEEVFKKILVDFGRIDIVIPNASGAGGAKGKEDLNDLDIALWQDTLKDNLLVAVTTAKHAIKALDKNEEGGKIVFIGSVLGLEHMGNASITAYSAGKAATHNFAKTIAKKLAPKIIVNCVAPGRCWSKAYEGADPEYVKSKFAVNRHGRQIEWTEIAHAVRMVLENDSIIGQIISVEAGFSLKDA